jgi:hypothetical protein
VRHEVVDFVLLSVEVEIIVKKHMKTIAVVETWNTKEGLLKAWETGSYNFV